MKKCNRCRNLKGDDEFYTQKKSGELYTNCIECVEIARLERLKERKLKFENGRKCPGCGVVKLFTEYREIDAKTWKFSIRCDKCMKITEAKKRDIINGIEETKRSSNSIKVNCDSPVWKNKPRCN